MKVNNNVKTLKIGELLTNDKYFIPIYQRNYSWGDEEISYLIQDLWNAYLNNENKNYYIGSLVVNKKENGDFEVIDGQQRLTTLTLIMHYFWMNNLYENDFTRNVHFEHRKDSDCALENLESDNIPNVFKNALKSIKKYWEADQKTVDKQKSLADFLLTKVEIIRTEVPENTDLNHYFEIMNTRGEQLEKHEVLKARLMKKLRTPIEKNLFAKIWDACSDMSRYTVMGFDSELREVIFGNDWQKTPRVFRKEILRVADELNRGKGKKEEDGKNGEKIVDLLNSKKKIELKDGHLEDKYDGAFTSVIDFPNFLMHVLRIYLEEYNKHEDFTQNVPLDEKFLLKSYEESFKDNDKEVRKLIFVLFTCRYLFDRYVIKSNTIRTGEENWSLWKIMRSGSKYYYKNSFSNNTENKNDDEELNDSDPTKKAVMLLSMFHVSNSSHSYKNWLYAVLRWLFKNKDNIMRDNYVNFLEELCDKFYFGNNCQGKDITEIILDKVEFELNSEIKENSDDEKDWDDGVNVPNFVFNRLDYQLWKFFHEQEQKVEILSENDKWLTIKNKEAIWKKFRFTFRSSVEHHYPQHPSEEHGLEKLDKKTLDNFGNLYLLSQSKNSRLSNLTPKAKCSYYEKNENYDSLKQAIMMSYDKWEENEIKEHGKEMLKILNQPLSKADS